MAFDNRPLPEVFLIGDSISMYYGPYLQKYLAGSYTLLRKEDNGHAADNLDIPTGANGGDSHMVLQYLQIKERDPAFRPDILLLNCGLHDIKRDPVTKKIQVDSSSYRRNLEAIYDITRKLGIRLVWINTTPVDDERHNSRSKSFYRYAADVAAYNAIAGEVWRAHKVPQIDLFGFTTNIGAAAHYIDHVHYDEAARALQAAFICGNLRAFTSTAGSGAAAGPVIPFRLAGKIKPRNATAITASNWSIGGETLDRDYADYNQYKQYLGPLGAKRIRFQGGWAKTEKVKGQYNWAWLDTIVNDALQQGVQPWIETSYGNPVYEGGGDAGIGGGIPTSEEALQAWDNWVRAMVKRYKNKVHEWEVWNEPDLSHKLPALDYARLYIRTAMVIRQEQPDARLISLVLAGPGNTAYTETFMSYLKAQQKLPLVDIITYHGYTPKPEDNYASFKKLKATVDKYTAKAVFWQGENGCPSERGSAGALSNISWSEMSQAKWVLRRMFDDLGRDITVTNIFQISDMYGYNNSGKSNTKGLLKINPDKSIDHAKPAYYAMQHVTALFDSRITRIKDFKCTVSGSESAAAYAYRRKGGKGQLVTIWLDGKTPADDHPVKQVDITIQDGGFRHPVYVDMLSGNIYEIPAGAWSRQGSSCTFRNIPLYDAPVLIAEADLVMN